MIIEITEHHIRQARQTPIYRDLVENHSVRLVDRFGKVSIYEVSSQTRDLVHLIVANGSRQCTCEDARKHNHTGCEHAIAVQIYEARLEDYDYYLEVLRGKE